MLSSGDFKGGDVLRARSLIELVDEVKRLGKLTGTSPVHVADDPSGLNVSIDGRAGFWIKITGGGTGGKYAWSRLNATTAGTWSVDTFVSGTTTVDPAYEAGLRTTVPITGTAIVRAWREAGTNELRFLWGAC
jgi:hypothetical protein